MFSAGWRFSSRAMFMTAPPKRPAPARQVPVEGRWRDLEPPRRLFHGDRRIRQQGPGRREVLVGKGRRPAAGPAPGPRGLEPGLRALVDDRALELRQRPEDMEDELAPGRGGVDGFRERAQADLRPESSSTVSISCLSERARRSSFQTTSVSPFRTNARAAASSGRSLCAPEAFSSKIFSHPAELSASSCKAEFWSWVETRA